MFYQHCDYSPTLSVTSRATSNTLRGIGRKVEKLYPIFTLSIYLYQ